MLASHCEILSGYPFPSAEFTDEPDDVHLVKGENVGQGQILWEISKRWPRGQFSDLDRFKLRPCDVVLAMDRPWIPAGLKFACIPADAPDALLVQRVARLRAINGLDLSFLRFLIASPEFESYIKNAVRGVTVPHISGKEIGAFAFNLPPADVQLRIAEALAYFEDLIDNNRRRIKLLEESARLLFDEWFVRLRFPGYRQATNLDGVPEGWQRLPLEQVLVLQRGFDLPIQDREDGPVPIYGATGINGFHNQVKVKGPGIVTGRAGSLGVVHFVPGDFWPLNTSLWVKELRRASPRFAVHLLRAMKLDRYGQGATMPMLDRKVVHQVPVLLPAPDLMARFESFATEVYDQIDTLQRQNQQLTKARDLLLPRLMSGQLAV